MTPWAKVARLARLRFGLPHVRAADRARDQSRWIDAIMGFRRGLDWMPWRDDLRVQIGNCFKELGDYEAAAELYTAVMRTPALYDAQKQLDDVDRRAGRPVLRYRVAEGSGDSNRIYDGGARIGALSARLFPNRIRRAHAHPRNWLGSLGKIDNLPVRLRSNGYATIKFDQIGSLSIEHAGLREPLFTGIVAVRGRIASMRRIDRITFSLGTGSHRIICGPFAVREVDLRGPLRLHVFNVWLDAARLPAGRHWFEAVADGVSPAGTHVNVEPHGQLADDFAGSNAYVPSAAGVAPEQAVMALPAECRAARRTLFDRPVRSILVMRADQLGDVCASLPAFARLRSLFPDAHITALVQPATAAVVAASGVADEVMTLTLDYDPVTERRHLSVDEEGRLRTALPRLALDLAIDLCPGDETRPLLLLSDATYLVGFGPDRFAFLDFGISMRSRDKVNQLEKVSHAATVLGLVEILATAIAPDRPAVPRAAPSREAALGAHDLTLGGYVVLHTGARHALNEWPLERFAALATAIVRETGMRVMFYLNPGAVMPSFSADVVDRIKQAGLMDADMFDEILSNAALVVGNDSGPKHLAAARGVATVSIQVGRLNWDEWGQDSRGVIVSKRVPCTGCGLNDVALCGRDAVCIRSISTAEVLSAVLSCLVDHLNAALDRHAPA